MTAKSEGFPEFFELLGALRDGVITEQQLAQLDQSLASDPEMQEYYVEYILLCTELRRYYGTSESDETSVLKAALMLPSTPEQLLIESIDQDEQRTAEHVAEEAAKQTEARKQAINKFAEDALKEFKEQERRRQEELAYREYLARRRQLAVGVGSIATILIAVAFVWLFGLKPQPPVPSAPVLPPVVATITRSLDAQWSRGDFSTRAGTRLTASPMYLKYGLVQIVFEGGAKVILQAPADLQLEDTGQMFLRSGVISAEVPERSRGLIVRTPTGTVVDYGTEFAVVVHKSRETEAHVYKGKVALRCGSDPVRIGLESKMLTEGQAGTIDSAGNIINKRFQPKRFIRKMPDSAGFGLPGRRLNLADIAVGGSGFGTGKPDHMIDLTTGRIFRIDSGSNNSPVKGPLALEARFLPGIDYLFVPDGGEGSVRISSVGHEFTECPDTDGYSYCSVANGGVLRHNLRLGQVAELVLGGRRYGTLAFPAMSMHANVGITFDLDIIREAVPGIQIECFSALCGVSETALRETRHTVKEHNRTDFWVLVDGRVCYQRLSVQAGTGAAPVRVELSSESRFLTLVVTDGGDNHGFDWGIFALPALELTSAMTEWKADKVEK